MESGNGRTGETACKEQQSVLIAVAFCCSPPLCEHQFQTLQSLRALQEAQQAWGEGCWLEDPDSTTLPSKAPVLGMHVCPLSPMITGEEAAAAVAAAAERHSSSARERP